MSNATVKMLRSLRTIHRAERALESATTLAEVKCLACYIRRSFWNAHLLETLILERLEALS